MEIAALFLFGCLASAPCLWAIIKKALGSKKPFKELMREITR